MLRLSGRLSLALRRSLAPVIKRKRLRTESDGGERGGGRKLGGVENGGRRKQLQRVVKVLKIKIKEYF